MRLLLFLVSMVIALFGCKPAVETVKKEEPPEESYKAFPHFRKEPPYEVTREEFLKAFFYEDPWQEYCSGEGDYSLKELISKAKGEIVYPKGGLVGDWKKGEALVLSRAEFKSLYGKRGGDRRGNCYACHCGDPRIIACGNIGPSLRNFAAKGLKPEELYEILYNPWIKKPCSAMPRYGHHGIYSPEEIAHIVAYLLDKESPINRED